MIAATVAVIGTGRMGPGVALAFAAGGCPVLLVGRGALQLQRAQDVFDGALAGLVSHDLLGAGAARAAAARLQKTVDIEEGT